MTSPIRKPGAPNPLHARFRLAALALALLIGGMGLLPHVRWSWESGLPLWFFNSYDEGYYGWLSLTQFSPNRILSDLVMHVLYVAAGANMQRAMILADFILPFGATLACCYLVRPLFASALGMAAGALFILVSAECLALRSTSIPHASLSGFLQAKAQGLGLGFADLVQLGNQTSTFWLFRTPEPQASWIAMFIVLGWALRRVMDPPDVRIRWGQVAAAGLLAGAGYLFCALAVGGVFLLFAAAAFASHRRPALMLGAAGLVVVATCFGLSLLAAGQVGGDSLVFPSRRPIFMISGLLGLLAVAGLLLRRRGRLAPVHGFVLALGLTPLCLANQQLVTGHMIYLLNFENFGLSQIGALAILTSLFGPAFRPPAGEPAPVPRTPRWLRATGAGLAGLALGGILLRSQLLSYANYLPENQVARSYETALAALPLAGEAIACDDFFQTDTLAVRLGRRPDYLIARDLAFFHPIARLENPRELPANGARTREALFSYLRLTGVSPAELNLRFDAITDPANPSWADRFMLGGLLYHHSDFWTPLTHGRDTKLPWIAAQKPMIVEDYARFLAREAATARPVVFVMREDKPIPAFLTRRQARPVALSPAVGPVSLKAYRISSGAESPPAN